MGQKINPISNRLGIIRGWDSNWYGGKNFGDSILEDSKIRKYLEARLAKASVSRIVIERTLKFVTITVCSSHPGVIIGKGGQEVDKLKEELKKITDKDVQINIFEVRKPELDAQIVGQSVNPGRKRRRVVTLRIQSVNLYLVHKLVYFDPVFTVCLDASGQFFLDQL